MTEQKKDGTHPKGGRWTVGASCNSIEKEVIKAKDGGLWFWLLCHFLTRRDSAEYKSPVPWVVLFLDVN